MKNLFMTIIGGALFITSSSAQVNSSVTSSFVSLESLGKEQSSFFYYEANPGTLAKLKNISGSIYSERKYLVEELNLYNCAIACPTKYGNFALKTCYAGSSLYNFTKIGLVYARSLGKKIDLAVQFNYNAIATAGYSTMSAVTADIGSIIHLTEKLQAGIQIANPKAGKLNKEGTERLPAIYAFGLGYDASDKFFFATEIVKEELRPVDIRIGFRYLLLSFLSVRAGINTSITALSYGLGLSWRNIHLDLITSFHSQLGITPGILISIKGKRSSDE